MLRIVNAINPLIRCRGSLVLQQQCGFRPSVEEKLGLPEKPKRPPSPFIRFLSKTRPEIVSKHPDYNSKDVIKEGSQLWKTATESTKKALQDEYKRDYETYCRQIAKYNESLSPQQKLEIEEAVKDMKDEKEKRATRLSLAKKYKELGRPLKPLSSFFLFAKSEQHNRGNIAVVEFQAQLSKKWHSMPESVKQKYIAEAAKAREAYDKSLEAWETKMIKQGHLDVVRQKILSEVLPNKGAPNK